MKWFWQAEKKYIEHEGDLTVFTEALQLAAARYAGTSCALRPALVILGGVLKGVYGGGGVRSLERAGLSDGFASALGVSAGAPAIGYFLARQTGIGTTIFYEECLSQKFINLRGDHIADVSYLARTWRGTIGSKKLDTVALMDSPTHAYISAVPVTSSIAELISLNTLTDPVEGIVAACAMPGLYFGAPHIEGAEYVDGAMTDPFPIRQLVAAEDPTSVLVFMNRCKDEDDTVWHIFFYDLYVKYWIGRSSHIWVWEKNRRRRESLAWLRASGIPYCLVYTDDEVRSFTRTKEKLIAAADRFEAYVSGLMERALAEKKA
jgi:predicted patatin/cPLA2 family phospholipase